MVLRDRCSLARRTPQWRRLFNSGPSWLRRTSIGCFTPPFGINIFVAQAVFKQPVSVIYPGVAPFIVVSVIVLVLITYVPEISLFLTRLHD